MDYQYFFAESNEYVRSEYFPDDESLFDHPSKFADTKIDLEDIEIKPEIYEGIISSLWRDNGRLRVLIQDLKQEAQVSLG